MLIGLTGAVGHGKSSVARFLVGSHDFIRMPFAYRLKSMLAQLGVPERCLDGTTEDKAEPLECLDGHSARWAMQSLGAEWGRQHMGPDFWVNIWTRAYKSVGANTRVVADDLRFVNEAARVRELGGIVVRVFNPSKGVIGGTHASESGQVSADIQILNDGSLEDLARKTRRLVVDWSWAERTAELI